MSEIRTNEIIPHFDYQKIDTEYDIFCLETSRKYISTGAGIIDAPLMNKNVRAVLFETGRRFYVLLNHSEDNFGNMKKILSDAEYGSSMSIMQKKSSELEKYQLLQLLINGLTAKKHPLLRFNNLTGHLYVFRPEWTYKSKENVIWSIPTIEVKVMEDCLIKLNVRTFTSTRLRSKITFTKRKFEEYPKYVLSTDNSMSRKTADDDAKTPDFILRQIDGRKSGVKFLNISSETDFEATKIGVLNEVAENFNERYSGMAAIEFKTIAEYTRRLARALHVVGMINIQFIVLGDDVYVIEVNPRSSRTVPYISKVTGIPIVPLATKVILGYKLKDMGYEPGLQPEAKHIAIKMPVFSFEKIRGADISLGPEMKSTGECLGIAKTFNEALYKAFLGAGINLPKYKNMIITVKDEDKEDIVPIAQRFQALGYKIYATRNTAKALNENGVNAIRTNKIEQPSPNLMDLILGHKIDLVIDTPSQGVEHSKDGFVIRRNAIETGVNVLTSLDTATALVTSLENTDVKKLTLIDIATIDKR